MVSEGVQQEAQQDIDGRIIIKQQIDPGDNTRFIKNMTVKVFRQTVTRTGHSPCCKFCLDMVRPGTQYFCKERKHGADRRYHLECAKRLNLLW